MIPGHTERDSEMAIEAGLTSSSVEPYPCIHSETHLSITIFMCNIPK